MIGGLGQQELASSPLLLLFLSFSTFLLSSTAELEPVAQSRPTLTNANTIDRIRVGDTIDVTVEGYSEYSRQITVRRDGFISYPLIDGLQVVGLSIQDLETNLLQALQPHLGQPRIFVELIERRQYKIYLLGEVEEAGQYYFEADQIYLTQALALAGGVKNQSADLTSLQVRRQGSIVQTINLNRLLEQSEIEPILSPDDVVYVPSRLQPRPVHVTGAVADEQQTFQIERTELDLHHALALAGGVQPDIADLSKAIVSKPSGERIFVNLLQTKVAVKLTPGDVLFIPSAYLPKKVSVMGEVVTPGQYAIKKPVDLIEVCALAGGWSPKTANLKRLKIFRADGSQELVDLLQQIETDQPISEVYPGDRIYIPERLRINWSAILTVTTIATLIYNMAK